MTSAFELFNLHGKTALITGGATGIGLEISRALARAGAKVMIAARREDVLESAVNTLMQDADIDEVLWHKVDLADRDSIKTLADYALETLGGVDIYIGNAGMKVPQSLDEVTEDAIDLQVQCNLTANIILTKHFLPSMRKKKWGRFIYCSSNASFGATANEMLGIYGIVKSGLNSLAQYVAAEAGRDGITGNAALIGATKTDMLEEHLSAYNTEERQIISDRISEMISVGRMAQPRELAGLFQLLASDAGSFITGALIPIDGGMSSLKRPNPIIHGE